MEVAVLYHDDFKKHSPYPYDHPENPARLDMVLEGLNASGLINSGNIALEEPPKGDLSIYTKVHSPSYLRYVLRTAESGLEWLDGDTYVSIGTVSALERLAGASIAAVKMVGRGIAPFILGRPPGHHAGIKGRALGAPTGGFCIVNTAALVARDLSRLGRVVVLDFDVHHGNGTQEIFYDDPSVFHVDLHQDPTTIYPGTGFPEDTGRGRADGTKINIIVPPHSGSDIYMHAANLMRSIIDVVRPDYIVVSAGFDAYTHDNHFSSINATSHFYHEVGRIVREASISGVAAVLEGGYGVGLEKGLPAFVAGLAGLDNPIQDKFLESGITQWEKYLSGLKRLARALKESRTSISDVVLMAIEDKSLLA